MNRLPLSRREWLAESCALLSLSVLSIPRMASDGALEDVVANPRGGYRFLPGVPFLSLGAVAADGFEVVRTTLRRPRPLSAGLQEIERQLEKAGRPIQALCGLELRSPRVPTPQEFGAMNAAYVERFDRMGLLIDGKSPVARTNVAFPVPELSIHGYSYTVRSAAGGGAPPTFILSAVPEVRNLRSAAAGAERPDFVASGDTTAAGTFTLDGLRKKTDFVLTALEESMRALGVQWSDATGVQFYTLEDAHPLIGSLILPRIGAAARLSVQWHHAHPPGTINIVEMDARGIRVETML